MKASSRAIFLHIALVIIVLFSSTVVAEQKIILDTKLGNTTKQTTSNGIKLAFKLNLNDILTVDKYQDVRISDGSRWISREEKNRIVLKVTETSAKGSRMQGRFITYSRSPRQTGAFQLNRKFASNFVIQPNGKYIVSNLYTMPNLRSMPSFPDRALKKGDEWQARAMELHKVGNQKILIPVMAQYKYVGVEELNMPGVKKRMLDRIEYKYTINQPIRRSRRSHSPIVRISGVVICVLWFDRELGIPVYDSSRLIYDFHLADGRHQKYLFRIESWYNKHKQINTKQKKGIVADIKKDLGDDKKVTVRPHKEGIVLELGDILFNYNKASLNKNAKIQLDKVASILKKYPNREIRILGHTDSTGSPVFNRRLSSARAKTVLKTLQSDHKINGRRLSFKGLGESAPVVSNATPDGRARNRRVEILIVTE